MKEYLDGKRRTIGNNSLEEKDDINLPQESEIVKKDIDIVINSHTTTREEFIVRLNQLKEVNPNVFNFVLALIQNFKELNPNLTVEDVIKLLKGILEGVEDDYLRPLIGVLLNILEFSPSNNTYFNWLLDAINEQSPEELEAIVELQKAVLWFEQSGFADISDRLFNVTMKFEEALFSFYEWPNEHVKQYVRDNEGLVYIVFEQSALGRKMNQRENVMLPMVIEKAMEKVKETHPFVTIPLLTEVINKGKWGDLTPNYILQFKKIIERKIQQHSILGIAHNAIHPFLKIRQWENRRITEDEKKQLLEDGLLRLFSHDRAFISFESDLLKRIANEEVDLPLLQEKLNALANIAKSNEEDIKTKPSNRILLFEKFLKLAENLFGNNEVDFPFTETEIIKSFTSSLIQLFQSYPEQWELIRKEVIRFEKEKSNINDLISNYVAPAMREVHPMEMRVIIFEKLESLTRAWNQRYNILIHVRKRDARENLSEKIDEIKDEDLSTGYKSKMFIHLIKNELREKGHIDFRDELGRKLREAFHHTNKGQAVGDALMDYFTAYPEQKNKGDRYDDQFPLRELIEKSQTNNWKFSPKKKQMLLASISDERQELEIDFWADEIKFFLGIFESKNQEIMKKFLFKDSPIYKNGYLDDVTYYVKENPTHGVRLNKVERQAVVNWILCNFENNPPEAPLEEDISRLKRITGTITNEFHELVHYLYSMTQPALMSARNQRDVLCDADDFIKAMRIDRIIQSVQENSALTDFAINQLNPFNSIKELEDFSQEINHGEGKEVVILQWVGKGEQIQSAMLIQFLKKFFPKLNIKKEMRKSMEEITEPIEDGRIRISVLDFALNAFNWGLHYEKIYPDAQFINMLPLKIINHTQMTDAEKLVLKNEVYAQLGVKDDGLPIILHFTENKLAYDTSMKAFKAFPYKCRILVVNNNTEIRSYLYNPRRSFPTKPETKYKAHLPNKPIRRYLYALAEGGYAYVQKHHNKAEPLQVGARVITDLGYKGTRNTNYAVDKELAKDGLLYDFTNIDIIPKQASSVVYADIAPRLYESADGMNIWRPEQRDHVGYNQDEKMRPLKEEMLLFFRKIKEQNG